ncbi:hypothetical protein [Formosa algae]|uniref:Uncharacterized protein n=1 Tax=Formosa algae TaxID=225843 RepID=A0A9X0YKJ7_9FLAO|nr:hypothetical protein [Formosa algae]MBP1838626.1 hypothetical protein [Formosa algae]MDQ0335126.1 hypothetical protein [Formosa algae]
MNSICCLLDACTVINLIHIDDNDFLLKKIKKLDVYINDSVFTEIRNNVYVKPWRELGSNHIDKAKREEIKKEIEQKLTFYRGKKNNNQDLLDDLGDDYFDRIKSLTNYTKRKNGELYSTGQALFLSRNNFKNVSFYTDDYPAKNDFADFFHDQQIGQIRDSVDFIILLYWLDENFTDDQLKNKLNELYSQYATEVVLLKKKLQKFRSEKIDAQFLKSKKEIALKLNELIRQLDIYEFNEIMEYYNFFVGKKSKCNDILNILQEYFSVFELDNNQKEDSLLIKIKKVSADIGKVKILKLNDLIN